MVITNKFSFWLQDVVTESSDKKYRHRLFTECPNKREEILQELTVYIQNAHEDARHRLRRLMQNDLDPFAPPPAFDPAEGYPEVFHMQTLKGYFGEIFAGLVAEYFAPFGENGWKVPTFLFQYHYVAFEQLEILRQTGGEAKPVPGRTGDDCLAFLADSEGKVIRILYCEAKCMTSHRTDVVAEAHKKVSESVIVDIPQIVETLKQRTDTDSRKWLLAIQQLMFSRQNYERCDMVSYICGTSPVQGGRSSWLSISEPHPIYTAGRRLEVAEIHLPHVEALIRKVYGKKDNSKIVVPVEYAVED